MPHEASVPTTMDHEERPESLIIHDAAGQRLAFLYYDDNAGRRSIAGRLSKDEARRIARAITRLPELMQRG
jgi:hypothetical protein